MADGYVPKPNSGNLFRVPPEKLTKDTAAPYEGEYMVVCPHCQQELRGWVKAWINDSKVGKFFGLRFKFREKQPTHDQKPQARQPARPAYGEDDKDPLPF
jgi:hypothetical protein